MTEPSGPAAGREPARPPEATRTEGDELHFRFSRPGDEAQIVDVFASAFGGFYPSDKPVDEADYIRWFTESHESHQGRVGLGQIKDRIVCCCGELIRDIKVPLTLDRGTRL